MKRLKTFLGASLSTALGILFLSTASQSASAACQLNSPGGQIKHVVYISFDNVHLRRDNPNIPSDLEQMPNLLNFIQNNGTISGNHHTPLISHTATDFLTTLTGLYGERMGVPVSNSYGFFKPDGSVASRVRSCTGPRSAPDGKPLMVNELGKTTPAPWVPSPAPVATSAASRSPISSSSACPTTSTRSSAQASPPTSPSGLNSRSSSAASPSAAEHRFSRHCDPLRPRQPALQQRVCAQRPAAG